MRADYSVFADPLANLDYDDALLRSADQAASGEVVRFWESSSSFVVLGRTGREEEDVDSDACRRDGVSILRRTSGGGTVLQGPGCLNFSLVLSKASRPELAGINASYQIILGRVLTALASIGVEGEFRPVCDLVLKGTEKKFSGNAQRRGRGYILHHGTILYGFDLGLVSRYLKMPRKMPVYRQARPHGAFITNIPVRPEDARRAIVAAFC